MQTAGAEATAGAGDGDTAPAKGDEPAAAGDTGQGTGGGGDQKQTRDGDPDSLPSWARDALKKANTEAAKYRSRAKELEPFEAKAREAEDASKTEIERATEKLTAAERRAQEAEAKAMRLEVAASKGLTPAQAKRLVGATVEELEADADELLASFTPQEGDEKGPPPGQPQERLRGGGDPTETPEEDPCAVAARIHRF